MSEITDEQIEAAIASVSKEGVPSTAELAAALKVVNAQEEYASNVEIALKELGVEI